MSLFRLTIVAAIIGCVGCSAQHGSTHGSTSNTDSTVLAKPASRFRFSFYLSGSGGPKKPQDSWTMDTTGLMTVKAVTPDSPGHWSTVNALAQLDQPDYDSLSTMIQKGRLWAIDSTDIDQQCAGDELYNIMIVPTNDTVHLHTTFQSCAQDYNLLLEPQRTQFKRLVQWFERMRVKYRPIQP